MKKPRTVANGDMMQHYLDKAAARLGGVEYHGDKTLDHMSNEQPSVIDDLGKGMGENSPV